MSDNRRRTYCCVFGCLNNSSIPELSLFRLPIEQESALGTMPQRRVRNEEGCGDDVPQSINYPATASGDSMPCSIFHNQDNLTRNKNKQPRSARYELEDALVGLCDAWFDEIKPHLVRNNIKLHVGGSCCTGEAEHCVPVSTSGTTTAPTPGPPSAVDCTHLNPASSPNCELCQLLVTAASYIESATRQAASVAPSSSPFALDFSTSENSRCSSDSETQL